MKRVVLAYSGGLDTSVCIPWLVERGYEVVALMANVGQNKDPRAAIRRAKIAGASKVVVSDLRQPFITDFIWPALKANALYEGRYGLATSLSRPLIARELARVARREGATAVAHGCTGKGNDQVRFEVALQILDPDLQVIAPVREWKLRSREEEIEYARQRGIPLEIKQKSPYSIDENLWGVSIECGVLENPWHAPPPDCYVWTKGAERRMPKTQEIVVDFEKGIPVGLNGKKMAPLRLIDTLNTKGALYGVGRTDMVENRFVGIKTREIYEAPAATLLLAAHRDLESLTLDRVLSQFKDDLIPAYSRLIYNGFWYSDLKKALDAFIEASQKKVTGSVRILLTKGSFYVNGRKSPHSLYREELATYSERDEFDQTLAKGFVDLVALPFKRPRKRSSREK